MAKSQADLKAEKEAQEVADQEEKRLQEERVQQEAAAKASEQQAAPSVGKPDTMRSYQLVSGIHVDKDGQHSPDKDNIVKSDKDLVALHGSDRFVCLG